MVSSYTAGHPMYFDHAMKKWEDRLRTVIITGSYTCYQPWEAINESMEYDFPPDQAWYKHVVSGKLVG